MKLPVKPKDDRDIINEDGWVGFANTTESRDEIVKAINSHEKFKAEKQAYRNALVNMCFCKRHLCERCGHVKELPQRCVNEQIRDEVFHKQALKQAEKPK